MKGVTLQPSSFSAMFGVMSKMPVSNQCHSTLWIAVDIVWLSHKARSTAMIRKTFSTMSSVLTITWMPALKKEFYEWLLKVCVREMVASFGWKQITWAEYRAHWYFPLRKQSNFQLLPFRTLSDIIRGSQEQEPSLMSIDLKLLFQWLTFFSWLTKQTEQKVVWLALGSTEINGLPLRGLVQNRNCLCLPTLVYNW